jgi:hypothetical protein
VSGTGFGRDHELLVVAGLREPQRGFVVDVFGHFFELVDEAARHGQPAHRPIAVLHRAGLEADRVEPRAVGEVETGFRAVPFPGRQAHQFADVAIVGDEFLVEVVLGPPGDETLDAGLLLEDRALGDEDRPGLRGTQRAFDVEEAFVRRRLSIARTISAWTGPSRTSTVRGVNASTRRRSACTLLGLGPRHEHEADFDRAALAVAVNLDVFGRFAAGVVPDHLFETGMEIPGEKALRSNRSR